MNIVAFLKKFIPAIPSWVTGFDAHWAFAGFVTLIVAAKGPHWLLVPFIVFGVLLAGVKEFYIDKHFETTPQTFRMNLADFGGYVLGIALALILYHL